MWARCIILSEVVSVCGVCLYMRIDLWASSCEWICQYVCLIMLMSACAHECLSSFVCVIEYKDVIYVNIFLCVNKCVRFSVFEYVKVWICSFSECVNMGICVNEHVSMCVIVLKCVLICVHSECDYVTVFMCGLTYEHFRVWVNGGAVLCVRTRSCWWQC